MSIKVFCTGKVIDGRLTYWMPLEEGDLLYTMPDEAFESGREAVRDAALAAKDDEINEAQGETLDWRN